MLLVSRSTTRDMSANRDSDALSLDREVLVVGGVRVTTSVVMNFLS